MNMKNDLTPLEELKKIRQDFYDYLTNKYNQYNFDIIETALKDYEEHKQILNDYGLSLVDFRHACFTFVQFKNSKGFEGVEKKLKVLEIIKEKEVNVFIFLHSGDLETYNDMVEDNRKLKQEEYDLLKEILCY